MSPFDEYEDDEFDEFDDEDDEFAEFEDDDDEYDENEGEDDDVYDDGDGAEAADEFEREYEAGDYGGDGPEWWTDDMPGDWYDLYDDSYEVEEFEIAIDY